MPTSESSVPKWKSIRAAFLAGLIALSPILVTAFVLNWLVDKIGGNFREFFLFFIPASLLEVENATYGRLLLFAWNLIAMIVAFAQITLLGYLTRYVAGKFVFLQTERLMQRVPLIGAIYQSVKQIVETFSTKNRAVFQKVVLVQFPRAGAYAVGFLTNRTQGEVQARTAQEVVSVFIPTTPNPTSGFLVMFPLADVTELDMTVGEAMKLIISGGAVTPPWPGPAVPAEAGRSEAPSAPTPTLSTGPST